MNKDSKILIVGLGLIGGSYALGLSKSGFHVESITLDQKSIDYAIEHKMIKNGTTVVKKEYVNQFDIVIFALYPNVFLNWIKEYKSYLKPNCLITDVTGIKGVIVDAIQQELINGVEFVPAHPMAGKEVYGVENADERIFTGANLIITPTKINTEEKIIEIEEIGKILKFKNIVRLTPSEHDEIIGFLSQLTHCIAIALMTCRDNSNLIKYTGDSFRDLTRIAKINENMWSELFLSNKQQLLNQMEIFIGQFNILKDAIESNNQDLIKKIMIESTKRRIDFDK